MWSLRVKEILSFKILDGQTFIFSFITGTLHMVEVIVTDVALCSVVKKENNKCKRQISKFWAYLSFGYYVVQIPEAERH